MAEHPGDRRSRTGDASRRLLCDEMLARLGRWLRAAGHDVAIVGNGIGDTAVLDRARAGDRTLLTRDRSLAARAARAGMDVIEVAADGLDAQAALLRRAGIDWLCSPLARCMLDNATLEPADAGERADLPPAVRAAHATAWRCPECGRRYWGGSHVERMLCRLRAWQAAAG